MNFITRVIVSRSQLYPWFSHTLWSHAKCKKYDYLAVSITTLSSEHLAFLSASVGNVFSHRTTLWFLHSLNCMITIIYGKKSSLVCLRVHSWWILPTNQKRTVSIITVLLKTCDIVAFCSLLEQDTIDSHLNCYLNKISSGCAMSLE